jgi:hypothetical protein
MPTTNLSQTDLCDNQAALELTQTKYGVVKSQITSDHPDKGVTPGDIHYKVSVERSSVSYPGSQNSQEREML